MTQELPKFEELVDRKKLPSFETLQVVERPAVTAAIDSQEVVAPQYGDDNEAQVKKSRKNPRPRKAQTLTTFREKHNAGHAMFYRYKRMQDPVHPYLVGPKGGACILVNMLSDEQFTFSYSVCSPKDAFIKDEARRLCQERFDRGEVVTLTNRDPLQSCFENILEAIYNFEDGVIADGPILRLDREGGFNDFNLSLLRDAVDQYLTVEPKGSSPF
jgi:hypothetical protein